MTSQKKQIAEARQRLRELKDQHEELVKKIERARRKMEKRALRLRQQEAGIARVEHQIIMLGQSNGNGSGAAVPPLTHAYLLFNPTSGPDGQDGRSPEPLLELLRKHGIEAEIGFKTSGKMARQLVRQAAGKKHKLVIVAGGDGTIEDAASQLVGTETTLGILPIGTRNNLARELGVPLDLDQACDLLAAGITRKVDVGRVKANARKDVEYFLESAGFGLSAVVLPAGQALQKGRLSKFSDALRKLFEIKPGPVEIELDSKEKLTANTRLVTVSNAPLLGVNLLVAPDAKMDDGLLDVAVYNDMTATDLAGYFLATTNGRRAYHPCVRFYRAKRVVIRAGEKLPAVSDKDPIADRQELEIELIPHALNAVVGNGIALTLPVEAVPSVPPLAGPQAAAPAPTDGVAAPADAKSAEPVSA